MFGFSRGDMPEAPPKDFANLPLPQGWTIKRFDTISDLDAYARKAGVSAADAWNPHTIESAVDLPNRQVLLMKEGYFDPDKEAAIERHEIGGHANGLEHAPDGKGWGWYAPDRTFFPVSTPQELQAVQSKYAAQPFDWSKAFAQNALMSPPAPVTPGANALTQTASTTPAVPPGLMGSSARQ